MDRMPQPGDFRGEPAERYWTAIAEWYRQRAFAAESKLEELSNARLSLWRGHCGHHWIKAESESCPACRLARIKHVIERDVPAGQSQIDFEADCCRMICDIVDPCGVESK